MAEGHFDYQYTGPVVTSGQLATRLTYTATVNYADGSSSSSVSDHFDGAFTTIPIHQHMTMNITVAAGAANIDITPSCFIATSQSFNPSSTFSFDSGFISIKSRTEL